MSTASPPEPANRSLPGAGQDIVSTTASEDVQKTLDNERKPQKSVSARSALEAFVLMTTLCVSRLFFLAALDITIVSTSLPTILRHFNSSVGYTWIGSTLLLAAAVVAASWGKFKDTWGRKPVLPLAIFTFFLSSALCGASVSLAMLLVGRAVQGAAGGGVLTTNTYFLPLYCQALLGASPILSGVLLLQFTSFMSIALVASGMYIKKTGRYLDAIRLGFALMTLGSGPYYDLSDRWYRPKIILYQLIAGFGIGLDFQPPMIALQGNIPPQDNGAATASLSLVRNIASAIGVVIGSMTFSNQMTQQKAILRDVLGK